MSILESLKRVLGVEGGTQAQDPTGLCAKQQLSAAEAQQLQGSEIISNLRPLDRLSLLFTQKHSVLRAGEISIAVEDAGFRGLDIENLALAVKPESAKDKRELFDLLSASYDKDSKRLAGTPAGNGRNADGFKGEMIAHGQTAVAAVSATLHHQRRMAQGGGLMNTLHGASPRAAGMNFRI